MDKPTKALILGVLVGAFAAGAGLMNSHRLERKVQELQTRCLAQQEIAEDFEQFRKEANTPGGYSAVPPPPPGFLSEEAILRCEPIMLARSNAKLVGTRQELATAQREIWQWRQWSISGGLAIAVFFALPWVWYFLLRRIRELREAIIGK